MTVPTASSNQPGLVSFKHGFTCEWAVVQCLLALEARGVRFELMDGGRFRVVPADLLSEDDRRFLRARRDEARLCLEYIERMVEQPQ
jgi:hypothetical protein